jgi:hypothetical protein
MANPIRFPIDGPPFGNDRPITNPPAQLTMIRLLYISISHLAEGTEEKDLLDILQSSKKNNPAIGITGILVHGGGMFMQILEGPDRQVLRKYVEILDDPRHAECHLVLITTTDKRAFPDWAMATLEVSTRDFQIIREMAERRYDSVEVTAFTELIKFFIKRLNEA